jgi:hypothetical protein
VAAITSNAVAGDWNATASWAGGVIPGNGDTVTIANGAVITIPVGVTVTVGDNLNVVFASAIPAIQANGTTGTGRLIVNGKLILKGHVKQANATWVVGPGATVNGGGTSGMNWSWAISLASSQANALLQINGTQAQPVTFGLEASADRMGTLGIPGSDFLDGGRVQATWCNFSGWAPNASTTAAYSGYPASAVFDGYFRDCTWTSCGIVQLNRVAGNDSKIEFLRCRIVSPTASNNRAMFFGANAWTSTGIGASGVRRIANCEIFGQVIFFLTATVPNDFTFTDNIFRTIAPANTASCMSIPTRCAAWARNVIYSDQNGNGGATVAQVPCGLLTDSLFLRRSNNASPDVDMLRVLNAYTADITIDGAVIEYQDCGTTPALPDTGGDFYIVGAQHATLSVVHTIKNTIYLPNEDGGSNGSSMVITHAATADWSRTQLIIEHCTWLGRYSTEGQFKLAEGSVDITAPAALGKCRSNLLWANETKQMKLTGKAISGGTNRIPNGAYDSCNYNAFHNNQAGNNVYSNILPVEYQNPAPPGPNDIAANPQFVDPTRDFLSWAQSVDASITTWDAAITAMSLTIRQVTGHNPSLTVADCLTWIRAGFVPQNPALKGTAHDGGDIGAVPVVVAAPPSISINPVSGTQGTASAVSITGTNTHFSGATTVAVSGSGVTVSGISVANAASLSCTFTIAAGAATGDRTVTVTTGAEVVTAAFTVSAPVVAGTGRPSSRMDIGIGVGV